MVEMGNITSICEVSLATNFVLGYLFLKYKDLCHKALIISLNKKGDEFTEDDHCLLLSSGKKFSKKYFAKIRKLLNISISLSSLAICISFIALLLAGISPEYQISSVLYVFCAIFFIIINPAFYFICEIAIQNFEIVFNPTEQINEENISNYMKHYVSFPIPEDSIVTRIKWFIFFKIRYLRVVFKQIFKLK